MSEQQQMLSLQQAIDLAVQHHKAGRLSQAESVYQQILQSNPEQPTALHLLGVIAHQTGKNDTAVDLITEALAIKPELAEAHSNLGLALQELGKLEDAVASYHKALALKPNYAEAYYNLGNALRELGKLEEAVASYRKALDLKPDYAMAHSNLGVTLKDLGKLEETIASYRRALAIKPDLAEAHNNLGNALRELGKLEDALASYRKALAIRPDYAEAHNNLGLALEALGKLEEAVASYQKALAFKLDFADARYNLGNVLRDLGKLEAAVASYRKALALKPDYAAEAHNNLGSALQDLGKLDDAVTSYRKTLALKPDLAEARSNLGNVLQKLGKLDEAIECLKRADPGTASPNTSANLLECYYRKQDQAEFKRQLRRISKNQRFNFRAASASAFVSQQLGIQNSYKFCDDPVDLVTIYDVLNAGDVSPDLIREIETAVENNRGNELFAPGHISSGFKSIGNLFAERTLIAETLEQVIRRCVGKFLQQHNNNQTRLFQNWPAEYVLDGWYIRMLSGGEITAHVHEAWLSGIFYVQVPAEKENDAGNIEFTLHGYDLPVVRDDFPRRIVTTKPGRLVLFPSSLPHRVFPFSQNQERITIAFDVVPKFESPMGQWGSIYHRSSTQATASMVALTETLGPRRPWLSP